MQERMLEFDYLRTIGTLAVIAIHVTAGYVLVSETAYLINQLMRFAVPLFLIISGYLLFYQDYHGSSSSTQQFYLHRFARVLWPYIIWTLVYFILNHRLAHDLSFSLTLFLHSLITGTASYHLYYVITLFQLYLIYPWLRHLVRCAPKQTLILSLLLSLIIQAILYFYALGLLYLPSRFSILYLVGFPSWLFYFILGMVWVCYEEYWKEKLVLHGLWSYVFLLGSFALLFLDSKMTASFGLSIRPSVMLYAVAVYVFLLGLLYRSQRRQNQTTAPAPALGSAALGGSWSAALVSWFSRQSFLVYLSHPLFISIYLYLAARLGFGYMQQSLTEMIMTYIAALIMTILLSYFASLIPGTAFVGGAPKSRAPKRL